MQIEILNSIFDLDDTDRHLFSNSDNPFTRISFLETLEKTRCCSVETGWRAFHVLFKNDHQQSIGFMPCYIKQHSWGEFVFDWSWAQAYKEQGLNYYPKLLTAIPFTPVPGPRILATESSDIELILDYWLTQLPGYADQFGFSSWHLLFPETEKLIAPSPLLDRIDCQYHWFNHNYQSFDDILQRFSSRKRKNIKKERQSLEQKGVRAVRYSGSEITLPMIAVFFKFYCNTYFLRGHQPHLNQEFFTSLLSSMPDNIMLVLAYQEDKPIAGSWFFFDSEALYGRYWGCDQEISALHFECCYYQGMEFCIEQKLKTFNPGTQGEHKISRGFEPVTTTSYHWIKHQGFNQAIENYLRHERPEVRSYMKQARTHLPFKKD